MHGRFQELYALWVRKKLMEEVYRLWFTAQWKIGRSRDGWKILTSPYERCDVAVGIDLGARKLWIHSVCNLGSLCSFWVAACFTRRWCCGLDDKGIIHHFLAGTSFLSSSEHSDNLQDRPNRATCSICTHVKVAWSGRKVHISCLMAGLRTCGVLCALPSHPLLAPQCGA